MLAGSYTGVDLLAREGCCLVGVSGLSGDLGCTGLLVVTVMRGGQRLRSGFKGCTTFGTGAT